MPGAIQPKNEGPIRKPAIISATACGWPTRRANQPTARQTTRMNASWRKKKAASSESVMILIGGVGNGDSSDCQTPNCILQPVSASVDLLPHALPMRLVEEIVNLVP